MIGQLSLGYQAWRAQWLSKPKLARLRAKRLRHTLDIAATLPFYRDHWGGVDATAITDPAGLRALPTIVKADFRDRLDDITVSRYDETNARVTHTSGSSGATLRLTHDWPSTLYCNAAWVRAHMAYGLKPHQRTAYFRFEPVKQGLTAKLRIFRNEFVPFGSGEEILADLRRIRPAVLGGYPSYFADLIRMVPHDDLRSLGVKWLYAGAETMPASLARQLRRIFDCPLIDLYGSTEFENMAFQCAHGNRHVSEDSIILEVLNADGEPAAPGETGDIVVTGLRNDAMPLVRYRIGDRGAWSDETCRCGRNFMLLSCLEGRTLEAVVTPRGKRYPVILLNEDLMKIDELFQFQVVQEAADRLTLNLVCAPGTEEETTRRSVKALVKVFDEPMTVTPKVLSAIPRGAGDKVKAIIPLQRASGN